MTEKSNSSVNVPTVFVAAGVSAVISALIVSIGVVGVLFAVDTDNSASNSAEPTVVNLGAAANPQGTVQAGATAQPTTAAPAAPAPTTAAAAPPYVRPSRGAGAASASGDAPEPEPEPEPEPVQAPPEPVDDEDLTDAERDEMIATARDSTPDPRQDPEQVAIELLATELGARPIT